jgi:hypothetical protein
MQPLGDTNTAGASMHAGAVVVPRQQAQHASSCRV